jgi:predicted ester cyclase
MSKLLTEPDGFQERPLYISVNITRPNIMNVQRIHSKTERDQFFKRAATDAESIPETKYEIIRVDSSGSTIIKPE